MGGSSSQTIGYKYLLGVHFVPCLGPVDAMLRIDVDKRTAWEGRSTGGTITIDEPELFGGKKREGGVSGTVDFMPGEPTQARNDYLDSKIGAALTSAYRGVMSIVLRQTYIGNNPYLKPWRFKVQRVFTGYEGAAQWYTETAGITRGAKFSDAAIYIALDWSTSMNTGGRWAGQKTAVLALLAAIKDNADALAPNDVQLVIWSNVVDFSITRTDCDATDYDDLIAWLTAIAVPAGGGTDFSAATSLLSTFYSGSTKRKVALFLTDGEPTAPSMADDAAADVAAIDGLDLYGFNIDLVDTTYTAIVDNTPSDGVPVVEGGDPTALLNALGFAFSIGFDMNPAHIIREVLISPDVGGSGDDAEVGETFTDAADTLYAEGFGLSFLWKEGSRQEFITSIEQHIDAKTYQDRRTGLWELKLIRSDYDPETVPTFGRAEIVEWEQINWPDPAELPNMVTVVYRDPAKEDEASVTLANPARIQQSGGKVNFQKTEYNGIYSSTIAGRVCARDLTALSAPLMNGVVVLRYLDPDLNRGDVIKLHDPEMGVENVICRILEIQDGDGRDNRVRVQVLEDKFGKTSDLVVAEDNTPEPTGPQVPDPRLVEETPYYMLVLRDGQRTVDDELALEPDGGRFTPTGKSPTPGDVNMNVYVDAGSGYLEQSTTDFSPVVTMLSALSRNPTQTKIIVDYDADLADIRIGSLAYIGGEYVRIDAVTLDGSALYDPGDYWEPVDTPSGAVSLIEVGRGCLDTVPVAHADGSALIFWQDYADGDTTQYLATEEIDVKLQTYGPSGTLALASCAVDTVTFNSRAIRPYPPGNLKADADYDVTPWDGSVVLTWAHRDRLTQTTTVVEDYADGDIGPEAGVTYSIRVAALDAARVELDEIYTASGITLTTATVATVDFTTSPPSLTSFLRFEVFSVRDGYESWTRPYVEQEVTLDYLLLSSSDELDPDDNELLSGDAQAGTDIMLLSGD